MKKLIKVVEVRTYVYDPDLEADVYKENEISNILDAMMFDRKDYADGGLDLSELDDNPVVNTEWSIIEAEANGSHKVVETEVDAT